MIQLNLFLYSVSFEEVTQPNTRCNAKTRIKHKRECDLAASLFGLSGGYFDDPLSTRNKGLWVSGCSYHISKEGDYTDLVNFNPRAKDGPYAKKYNYKSICKAPRKF